MEFEHSAEIWRDFPELVAGVVFADGITPDAAVGDSVAKFTAIARSRLAGATESELPEIRAWRRAFTRMGLKPTQYRCASEALLRRFRKDGALSRLHPLVDMCNAVSAAFAIPVAVFDLDKVTGRASRPARGDLRRPGSARACPPVDQPAKRTVGGAGLDGHRAHRGRGHA
jgi:DNA/RNA-binding domain of Phe-tRNA-synthetase-like protein